MKNVGYELVVLAQEGNEDAIKAIYNIFRPVIIKKSKHAIFKVANHGVDIDDIIQEGCMGLDEAIKNYSQDEDALFYTFAMICIERQIANFIRKVTSTKDRILNEAIVIDEVMENIISDDTNIESSLASEDYKILLINKVRTTLTPFEKKVLDLKIRDYSLDEMAKALNRDKKAIYNAIQRVKIKFRNFNKNDD